MAEVFSDPWLLIPAAVAYGLLIGSFLNVVIHRLPKMLENQWQAQCAELRGETLEASPRYNLIVPRSACPSCKALIRSQDNIPVLSWLWLRGKCRACKAAISGRYPAVELIAGVIGGVVAWRYGFSWQALAAGVFLWTLLALTLIDYDTQLLPDNLTVPLLWLGLIVNSFGMFTDWKSALWGAVAGYLILWSIYWLFKLLTGKEGMGYGDFKLLAALGAWMGWQMLPVIILLSSLVGAVVGITLIVLKKHQAGKPIPFGPYLAGAGALAFFFGPKLVESYLGLYR